MLKNAAYTAEFLTSWLKAYDRLWLNGQLEELAENLQQDVVFVAPRANSRTVGIDDAVSGYRTFLETATISQYDVSDFFFTRNGATVIAEYSWTMAWISGGVDHSERGHEILAMDCSSDQIKIFWRRQIPANT